MKGMIHKLFVVVSLLMFAGCSNGNVELIKKSTFGNNSTVNIGKTLGLLFSGGDWDSKEKDGRTTVIFSGKVKKDTHDKLLGEKGVRYMSGRIQYYAEKIPEIGSKYQKKMGPFNKKIEEYKVANEETLKLIGKLRTDCIDVEERLKSALLGYQGDFLIDARSTNVIETIKRFSEKENKSLEKSVAEAEEARIKYESLRSSKDSEFEFPKNVIFDFRFREKSVDEAEEARIKSEFEFRNKAKLEFRNKSLMVRKEIKNKKERLCSQRVKLSKKYKAEISRLQKEHSIAEQEIIPELVERISEDYFFPTGGRVEFEWTIYPSGDKFKFTDISCETIEETDCAKLYLLAVVSSM